MLLSKGSEAIPDNAMLLSGIDIGICMMFFRSQFVPVAMGRIRIQVSPWVVDRIKLNSFGATYTLITPYKSILRVNWEHASQIHIHEDCVPSYTVTR